MKEYCKRTGKSKYLALKRFRELKAQGTLACQRGHAPDANGNNNNTVYWYPVKRSSTVIYEEDLDHFCGVCKSLLDIVRPGKYQCNRCE